MRNAAAHDGSFPIAGDVKHALGSDTPAISCNSCHGNGDSFRQFDCLSCHAHADKAALDRSHSARANYAYASASCLACHPRGTAAGAVPSGLVRDPARDLTISAQIPSYAGTSISSLNLRVEALPMPMDHATTQLAPGVFSRCNACHASASIGSYYPGDLHSSLANLKAVQPVSCLECHLASVPAGLVGPANPSRSPVSGEMKHDAVAWSNGFPSGKAQVTQDCATCHATPTPSAPASWNDSPLGTSPALFHASLTRARDAQPDSCLDCHANSRPAGLLTSVNAALPAGLQFDHAAPAALADCAACHTRGTAAQWTSSWSAGQLHRTGDVNPASCLPCHAGERPTSAAGWTSQDYKKSPFDTGTNAQGITHGAGLDCAACHAGAGSGAWGGTQDWTAGRFSHGPTTLAASTCSACHASQRPDLQPGTNATAMAALLGFDHSLNGTGDCFGCHQATLIAKTFVDYLNPSTRALPGGDWKDGSAYPGATLIGAPEQVVTTTDLHLTRTGAANLVTGTSATTVTLHNQMLHTATAIPPQLDPGPPATPDATSCWHCHTSVNGTVTAFANGKFHSSLAAFSATPGGTVTPLPMPSQCSQCHTLVPPDIVEKGGSNLQPMDHGAQFTAAVTIGGVPVSGVAGIECGTCHGNTGTTWTAGLFHSKIGAAVPADCTVCHYPGMADSAKADLASGTTFTMKHKSSQLTFQNCQQCHLSALAQGSTTPLASTLWQGATLHPNLATRPQACIDCHAASAPVASAPTQSSVSYPLAKGATATNGGQWMNHGATDVVGKDCALCHAADAKATGSAWSKADVFHLQVPAPANCQSCHGLGNGGGGAIGTKNNLPLGLTDSTKLTTASGDPTTGVPAGTHDQLNHADLNVASHDCSLCHTQRGVSTAPGIQGKEWAQAGFHLNFTPASPLVTNGTTGRCSNCHLNVLPGAAFTGQNHSAFTGAPGTQDCAACHSFPGTGTVAAANWLGAAGGSPQFISVGGFAIPQPPATVSTTQAGIANLPHPTVTGACTQCHASAAGGLQALGYDHASPLANTKCSSCHEAGSNLLGTGWNGTTAEAQGAGDTRPFTLTGVYANNSGNTKFETFARHFYPIDCGQCHNAPAGVSHLTSGTAYLSFSTSGGRSTGAWAFPHTESKMTNPSTCLTCHPNGPPN